MSDRTTSVPSDNATSATPNPESQLPTAAAPAAPAVTQQGLEHLALAPLYATARPEVQALLRQDMAAACAEGLEECEYVNAVTTWGGTIEELLAESGIEVPAAATPVQQSAEEAAEQEAELRKQAAHTLNACQAAHVKGERAYRAGLLEAGRLAHEYVVQRITLADKRAAAITAVVGRLAESASGVVDENYVGKLIRSYQAHRLLAEEAGLTGKGKKAGPADSVPWGLYRDSWCRLVERVQGDTPQESYILLPGLEADCKAAFGKAVADNLSRLAVADLVAGLCKQHAKQQADAEKQQAAAAAEKAKAERAALEEQAAKVREATAAHEKATADAKANASEETAAAVQESADKLLAEQRAVLEQQARVEQADREKAAADKRAKAEADRVAKEAAKVAAKAEERKATSASCGKCKCEKGVHRPPCKCECHANCGCGNCKPESLTAPVTAQTRGEAVTGNLLRSAKEGTAKDVGDMAAEFLLECEQPDDALEAMLAALVKSGDLSGKAKRACEAALLILARKDTPKAAVSPVEVARMKQPASPAPAEQVNGQVEPAAA